MKKQIIIMGAAGRDFHNFNVLFRDNPSYNVVAFTAAQIPFIQNRIYPKELAGSLYPNGIPIYPEEKLPELIRKHAIDKVVFSYSDVSHEYVMRRASLVNSLGADFALIGSERTMLKSKRPVISVCAVRTGCGKSGVSKKVCMILKELGKKPAAIRHPMPYGNLLKQRVLRFEPHDDITNCTIEEREEFEPLIEAGIDVYAGVDYADVLKEAEKKPTPAELVPSVVSRGFKQGTDIIVWDGGNNDTPFIKPDLEIVVLDPLRPGHEIQYYPGEVNFRRADVFVINKMDTAKRKDVNIILKNINEINPEARIIYTSSVVTVDDIDVIKGKNVLVVEDGPTLTHGGMSYGAGVIAARKFGAKKLVDPMPYANGTLKETFKNYPNIKNLIPAMGYNKKQTRELEKTINSTPCDVVLIATPVNLKRLININKPCVRVKYEIKDTKGLTLKEVIREFIRRL